MSREWERGWALSVHWSSQLICSNDRNTCLSAANANLGIDFSFENESDTGLILAFMTSRAIPTVSVLTAGRSYNVLNYIREQNSKF